MKSYVCKICKMKLLDINVDHINGKALCPICGQEMVESDE